MDTHAVRELPVTDAIVGVSHAEEVGEAVAIAFAITFAVTEPVADAGAELGATLATGVDSAGRRAVFSAGGRANRLTPP